MEKVVVSVIVASYNSKAVIEACLTSLEAQSDPGALEVIVVDSSDDGTGDLVQQRFPKVRLLRLPRRAFPGTARNVGVAAARGEILAFMDADCFADAHWVSEIIKAHERESPLIGGVIDIAGKDSFLEWAYFFCDLTPWMPGTPAGPIASVPTGCLTLKRWAFDACGPFLEDVYSSDTALSWKLRQLGYTPAFDPALKVAHRFSLGLVSFLEREVTRGRHFAAVRAREQRFSTARRIAYCAASPLLPLLLFYRRARDVFQRRTYRKQFVLVSPLVFALLSAWGLGEGIGYLTGRER